MVWVPGVAFCVDVIPYAKHYHLEICKYPGLYVLCGLRNTIEFLANYHYQCRDHSGKLILPVYQQEKHCSERSLGFYLKKKKKPFQNVFFERVFYLKTLCRIYFRILLSRPETPETSGQCAEKKRFFTSRCLVQNDTENLFLHRFLNYLKYLLPVTFQGFGRVFQK